MIVLPPEVDELTDEEGFDDTETLDPSVRDVADSIEIFVPYKNHDDHREANLSNKTVSTLEGLLPIEVFEEFLSPTYLEHILTETEKYAKQWENKPDFSLTTEELKAFIGFLILSGYHTLSSERDYWSDEVLMVPRVKNSMTRNRYLEIKSMIHFANNNEAKSQANDRAFKIQKLITEMNRNFRNGEFLTSIDKMMIRYYGHHYFKQYIKGKPIRFGYKMWALCGNNGYCYNFDLYCGKEVVEAASTVVISKEPLRTRVVKKMLQPVTDPKSHIVYFDNFFNSYNLLVDLRKSGFQATGTISDRIKHCPLEIDSIFRKTSGGSHDFYFDVKNKFTVVK
ncbi:piggyBac transposable element-derived protein 2 [Trichonephila clavipes]|nr:piggyBac transposable element-derived protein 2 [Trichonephila clavipes]